MRYTEDKKGRSVRELAMLKWFVRTAYVDLPDRAIDQWAETL